MNKFNGKALVTMAALLLAGTAQADPILHIWSCQLNEGKTGMDLMEANQKWLAAAKEIDDSDSIEASVEFPYAANVPDGSFNFVMSIENAAAWGAFQSKYPGSAVEEADAEWSEVATCQNSSLWNVFVIE